MSAWSEAHPCGFVLACGSYDDQVSTRLPDNLGRMFAENHLESHAGRMCFTNRKAGTMPANGLFRTVMKST